MVPPYFNGRFTNGRVYIELVAQHLNIDPDDTDKFENWSFGAAYIQFNDQGLPGFLKMFVELDYMVSE